MCPEPEALGCSSQVDSERHLELQFISFCINSFIPERGRTNRRTPAKLQPPVLVLIYVTNNGSRHFLLLQLTGASFYPRLHSPSGMAFGTKLFHTLSIARRNGQSFPVFAATTYDGLSQVTNRGRLSCIKARA
ncbi:Transcription regulator protein [Anopheles sinensis]|uniref:Transcription regulator protein n=1 Tax=Anopheles sinensis TaxID=74873 RepID=A0A084VUU8_ANOSI|nr:Transcription regulator protein [Anopheles sinensis]